MGNNKLTKYKSTARAREYGLQYYRNNKETVNARRRARYATETRESVLALRKEYRQSERGKQVARESYKRVYKTQRHKVDARTAVRLAVDKGILEKLPCEECGETKVEAHHYKGYEKEHRLDVQWLCRLHHRHLHNLLLPTTDKINWSVE